MNLYERLQVTVTSPDVATSIASLRTEDMLILVDLTQATIDLRRETSKGLDGKPADALARIELALTNLGYCPRHGLPLVCVVCNSQSNTEVTQ